VSFDLEKYTIFVNKKFVKNKGSNLNILELII